MSRRTVASRLTRRIVRGLKRKPPGGPSSWSEIRKQATAALRSLGWRLDNIRKKGDDWTVRSRLQRVGDVSVVIRYDVGDAPGIYATMRSNIEAWAWDTKSEKLIANERLNSLVRPSGVVRALKDEIAWQRRMEEESRFDY